MPLTIFISAHGQRLRSSSNLFSSELRHTANRECTLTVSFIPVAIFGRGKLPVPPQRDYGTTMTSLFLLLFLLRTRVFVTLYDNRRLSAGHATRTNNTLLCIRDPVCRWHLRLCSFPFHRS